MSLRIRLFIFLFPVITVYFIGTAIVWSLKGEVLVVGSLALIYVGCLCNWLVLRVNNWKMPVLGEVDPTNKTHVRMSPHHYLTALADIIPMGSGRASIGDLLIYGGVVGLAVMLPFLI